MNNSHVEDGDLGYFLRGARFLQIAFQNYVEASSKLKVLENLIVFFFFPFTTVRKLFGLLSVQYTFLLLLLSYLFEGNKTNGVRKDECSKISCLEAQYLFH